MGCLCVILLYGDGGTSETNSMVEEFMLLANIYTAEKTRAEFPRSAVLRRHPSPPETNFLPLVKVSRNKVRFVNFSLTFMKMTVRCTLIFF